MSLFGFLFISFFVLSCHQDDKIESSKSIDNSYTEVQDIPVDSNCDYKPPIYSKKQFELSREELKDLLRECYAPEQHFSYSQARTYLYSEIDVIDGKLHCLYSGYSTSVEPGEGQSYIKAALAKGINCEHVFPQSMGAGGGPAKSDLFHIYPSLMNVNSARGHKYFAEIPDQTVFEWFYSNQVLTKIPDHDIDLWNESVDDAWEPREAIKGDVARSVFYFVLMYGESSYFNQDFFDQMVETLLLWNEQDPVDQKERNRNNKIAELQGNNNPFILDPSLANRLYE